MYDHKIATPHSLLTSSGADWGVKPADQLIKPQPSAAAIHSQTSTLPVPPSSSVPVRLLDVPQQDITSKDQLVLPERTSEPSSLLERQYDENGNYIPPHMRTPIPAIQVQPGANGDHVASPSKEIELDLNPVPLARHIQRVQSDVNGDLIASPLKEIQLNVNLMPIPPHLKQVITLETTSDSPGQNTVTEPASSNTEVARTTRGETEKAETESAGKHLLLEASPQTPQKVSTANEAGCDEVNVAAEVEPVIQDIDENNIVEPVAKRDTPSLQTPPGLSKGTGVDEHTTGPRGEAHPGSYNDKVTETTKPRTTNPSPSPRTPQKFIMFKNSAPSPSPSPAAGASKQPSTRRPSPFAKHPKPVGKHVPVDVGGDGNTARWSYNSEFGGTEGGVREIEDDDDGLKLQDWNGKWMAAPVEWDARPAFNNVSAKFAASVHRWVEEESAKAVSLIDVKQRGFLEGVALGTGTDQAWEIIPEEDQGDTQLYPEDDYTPTKLEQTSKASAKAYTAKLQLKESKQKADRKAVRAANKACCISYIPAPNPYVPKANIYIRPAHVGDLYQIKDIYAWYITNTVVAPEREVLDRAAWQNRLRDVDDCKLPFLVAVTKNNRTNRRHANYREVIVGFGFADLFAGQFDAFKYAVEMQVFVHHQHKRVGVGKTLVDRLLAALDPLHMSRNGTEFFAENTLDYEEGGRRTVGRVLATIPYDPTDDGDFQWQKKWLAEWDFECVATLPKIGYKMDKA